MKTWFVSEVTSKINKYIQVTRHPTNFRNPFKQGKNVRCVTNSSATTSLTRSVNTPIHIRTLRLHYHTGLWIRNCVKILSYSKSHKHWLGIAEIIRLCWKYWVLIHNKYGIKLTSFRWQKFDAQFHHIIWTMLWHSQAFWTVQCQYNDTRVLHTTVLELWIDLHKQNTCNIRQQFSNADRGVSHGFPQSKRNAAVQLNMNLAVWPGPYEWHHVYISYNNKARLGLAHV